MTEQNEPETEYDYNQTPKQGKYSEYKTPAIIALIIASGIGYIIYNLINL